MAKKALIVVTSTEKYEKLNKATGLWLGEAVHFYDVLAKDGWSIDLVSPKGGYTPIDPSSLQPEVMSQTDWKYYADEKFRHQLGNTLKPSQVKAQNYSVIYYAGGHGTVFDFVQNSDLQKIASVIYQNNGIVSGVCHGVVGLFNIKLKNGERLINDRKVTGFSNDEETTIGLDKSVPFLTETQFGKLGAKYHKGDNWSEFVVVDDRLITGQNPQSSKAVAEKVLAHKF